MPGHNGFEGNELADLLAKEAAKDIEKNKTVFYEGKSDKGKL